VSAPDIKDLIGEVAARHGIRLEPDDPALALVTLHRLVFEHVVAEAVREIQTAADRFGELQSTGSDGWQRLTDELSGASRMVHDIVEALERAQLVPSGPAPRLATSPQGKLPDEKDIKRLQSATDAWAQQLHLAGERALRMADEFGRRFRWTLVTVASLCFLAGAMAGATGVWLIVRR
jgi:hypothetical protein